MRRFQNSGPKVGDIWRDLSGFYPLRDGAYKVGGYLASASLTATGEVAGNVSYGFCSSTLSGTRAYAVGTAIWEFSSAAPASSTLTDRTGGVTLGTSPFMTQYGNVTICAMGASSGKATVSSTGGNFAAIATSPNAEIVLNCSNAVVALNYYDGVNTYNDGWWASDIGDYTTWTPASSNDAANARLLDTNGPITGGAVLNGSVYAFKRDSIYRGTYVGAPFYWRWDIVSKGIGALTKYGVCECSGFIAFIGSTTDADGKWPIYAFDGVSEPVCLNIAVDLDADAATNPLVHVLFMVYDQTSKTLYVGINYQVGATYRAKTWVYSFESGAWGVSTSFGGGAHTQKMMVGSSRAIKNHFSLTTLPPTYYLSQNVANNVIVLSYPDAAPATIASYVETGFVGRPEVKTRFSRVTPLCRVRTNGTSPAAALTVNFFRELHSSSAASTLSVSESSQRGRFDFMGSDNYATFKIAYTNIQATIEDVLIFDAVAGTD